MSIEDRLPLQDRRQAGELLATELCAGLRETPDLTVLALPRGGVPVAWEIARALHAPMDVFVVRKIGLPGHPEFAIGAIATGGVQVMDPVAARVVRPADLQAVIERESAELQRREQAYRAGQPPLDVQERTVLLVDDGIATGATMEAAVRAVRALRPRQVIVAAPVGSASAAQRLRPLVDRLVFGVEPEPFGAVGLWYREFSQYEDEQVQALLTQARQAATAE